MHATRPFVAALFTVLLVQAGHAQMRGPALDGLEILPVQSEAPAPSDTPSVAETSNPSRGVFHVNAGVNFIRPFFHSNPAFQFSFVGQPGRRVDFDYDVAPSPHVALGYDSPSGWGLRLSWFEFDQAADQIVFAHPGTGSINGLVLPITVHFPQPAGLPPVNVVTKGQTLTFSNGLDLDVMDLEITRRFLWGSADTRVSLGARSLYLFQDFRGYAGGVAPPPLVSDYYLRSSNTFNGIGPTCALEIVQPLGSSMFSVYGTGRLSLLCGDFRSAATRTELQGGVVISRLGVASSQEESIFQGDLELGIEASRRFGAALGFLRTGIAGQCFEDAGNAIVPGSGNLRFLGLALTAGLEF